ncbi:MAG: type II toxin-antitoxin system HicB family antitoxin [bacterium]|nr:type II toxin-antitoxin system HicB family antitoxin [bacterium]
MISEYIKEAMEHAVYEKLEDGTYAGKIPECKGVVAFEKTLRKCEEKLQSVLEAWVLLGFKMKHPLPVIGNIDLNRELDYAEIISH